MSNIRDLANKLQPGDKLPVTVREVDGPEGMGAVGLTGLARNQTFTESDKKAQAKLDIADRFKDKWALGLTKLEPGDIKYIEKGRLLADKIDFMQWFKNRYYKLGDVEKEYARQLYPAFFQDMAREDKHVIKLIERLRKIARDGVANEADMKILYLYETGKLNLNALTMMSTPFEQDDRLKNNDINSGWTNNSGMRNFKRGAMNPYRLSAKASQQSNIMGKPQDSYVNSSAYLQAPTYLSAPSLNSISGISNPP